MASYMYKSRAFLLNGHTIGCGSSQTQKLELHAKPFYPCESTAVEISIKLSHNTRMSSTNT